MALRYSGRVSVRINGQTNSLSPFVLSGVRKHPRVLHYEKNTANLLVLFREGGSTPFFKVPLNELVDASIALDEFLAPGLIHKMEDRLPAFNDNRQRIAFVSQVLLSIINENNQDSLVLHSIREIEKMKTINNQVANGNKEIIRRLYEECFNTGRLKMLDQFISEEYIGIQGERGPDGFATIIKALRSAFPDIHWKIEDMIAEDDKVVIRWIQTDRLGFLQQIGILPEDLSAMQQIITK